MLAQREYTKKYGTTDITKLAPDQETVMGDLGSRGQAENPYRDTPEAFGLPANPVPPTEQRGAEGMTQGQRMDYFRYQHYLLKVFLMHFQHFQHSYLYH